MAYNIKKSGVVVGSATKFRFAEIMAAGLSAKFPHEAVAVEGAFFSYDFVGGKEVGRGGARK